MVYACTMRTMPCCQMSIIVAICTAPSENVHQKKVPDLPFEIIMLENSVAMGIVAPAMHSICISSADASHFSPMAITMNSLATSPKPNNNGKAMNAVKRIILRNTSVCLPGSLPRLTSTGCATCATMLCTSE